MRIDDLDDRMRGFESALDPCVLPGVYMVEEYERTGENPVTGERAVARRRRIRRIGELPLKDAYSAFLRNLMTP